MGIGEARELTPLYVESLDHWYHTVVIDVPYHPTSPSSSSLISVYPCSEDCRHYYIFPLYCSFLRYPANQGSPETQGGPLVPGRNEAIKAIATTCLALTLLDVRDCRNLIDDAMTAIVADFPAVVIF